MKCLWIALALVSPAAALAQGPEEIELSPIPEAHGVGFVTRESDMMNPITSYTKTDGSDAATYGSWQDMMTLRQSIAWAVFDASGFKSGTDVLALELSTYVIPSQSARHETFYAAMTLDPRSNDAQKIWDAPFEGYYAQNVLEAPVSEGLCAVELNELAREHLEAAIDGGGLFIVKLQSPGYELDIRGWGQDEPLLRVSYDEKVPIADSSWGRLKALY